MGTKAFALSAIVAVSLAVTGSYPANAQSYPERLIKIVVPFPAGGPSDVAARLPAPPRRRVVRP
jgi:tripartite-type tricarboxylate transporter receptor subunit TctC